jgi:hypothetical protein
MGRFLRCLDCFNNFTEEGGWGRLMDSYNLFSKELYIEHFWHLNFTVDYTVQYMQFILCPPYFTKFVAKPLQKKGSPDLEDLASSLIICMRDAVVPYLSTV